MDLVELEARLAQFREQEKLAISDRSAAQADWDALLAEAVADEVAAGGEEPEDADQWERLDEAFPHLEYERLKALDDARRTLGRAKTSLSTVTHRRRNAEADFTAARERSASDELAEIKAGRIHFDQRFHTSLAIAHGAAFAAIVNHAFDKDTSQAAIRAAVLPLALFALGLLLGGAIPWVRGRRSMTSSVVGALSEATRNRRTAAVLAGLSAGFFILGVIAAVAAVSWLGFRSSTPESAKGHASAPPVQSEPKGSRVSPPVPKTHAAARGPAAGQVSASPVPSDPKALPISPHEQKTATLNPPPGAASTPPRK